MDRSAPSQSIVDWAFAGRALDAGDESGDEQLVVSVPDGVLLAVIDGLGHGPEAALAAREATRVLERDALQPMADLIRSCHEELRKTRGVAMTLARFSVSDSTLEWCGVGNVDAVVFRADSGVTRRSESIITSGGVVGYRLVSVRVSRLPVFPGDMLVLTTDGIGADFPTAVSIEDTPQTVANAILDRFGKANDDALVLVARYLGPRP